MTLLTPIAVNRATTAAESHAAANTTANLAALGITQPVLADALCDLPAPPLTWLFARDGSLHAMHPDGQWFAGCSIPLLAGRAVLKGLESDKLTSCYLAPAHAGLLRAARERMGDEPALLAIVPDLSTLGVMLACHDFADQIASHHLWFAAGEDWPAVMQALFDERPGLPTPARFIRTRLVADNVLDPMITEAQRVFSTVLADRTRHLEALRAAAAPIDESRVLLIAGSRFRLWDDAPAVLADQLAPVAAGAGLSMNRFDIDDPATSSPPALASAASGCGVVVAANVARADAAGLVAGGTMWITWVTRPVIPPFESAGARDALVLADPDWSRFATAAGWPIDRVTVAGWPAEQLPPAETAERTLAIVADTRPIEIPPSVEDFSSHRVLWANIDAELRDHPLAVDDPLGYLHDRAARMGIAPDALDRRRFIDDLIVPAYEQGCARLLIAAGLPVSLHGSGWNRIDEFTARAQGPVPTRRSLHTIAANSAALVYVWPARHAHAIEALGCPIVHYRGRHPESFIREAKTALRVAPVLAPKPPSNSLAATILHLMGCT